MAGVLTNAPTIVVFLQYLTVGQAQSKSPQNYGPVIYMYIISVVKRTSEICVRIGRGYFRVWKYVGWQERPWIFYCMYFFSMGKSTISQSL